MSVKLLFIKDIFEIFCSDTQRATGIFINYNL